MVDMMVWLTVWYFIIGGSVFIMVWAAFATIMRYKDELRLYETFKDLPPRLYWLLPVGIIGWLGDVFWNIFYATPLFLQWPHIYKGMRIHDITLSHRLRQILRNDTSIKKGMVRWAYADDLCRFFIEPHDCTHCGRNEK